MTSNCKLNYSLFSRFDDVTVEQYTKCLWFIRGASQHQHHHHQRRTQQNDKRWERRVFILIVLVLNTLYFISHMIRTWTEPIPHFSTEFHFLSMSNNFEEKLVIIEASDPLFSEQSRINFQMFSSFWMMTHFDRRFHLKREWMAGYLHSH